MAEHPVDERQSYSVDLYMSTFSTHHVKAKTEEEAYALAKKERQQDLEQSGKDSSTVEYWLNRWQAWPDCDTVEEEELAGCWRPSPTEGKEAD